MGAREVSTTSSSLAAIAPARLETWTATVGVLTPLSSGHVKVIMLPCTTRRGRGGYVGRRQAIFGRGIAALRARLAALLKLVSARVLTATAALKVGNTTGVEPPEAETPTWGDGKESPIAALGILIEGVTRLTQAKSCSPLAPSATGSGTMYRRRTPLLARLAF